MFIIRKLHRLFRLYTFVLLCGIVMVGIDYDMRAKAVGQTIGTYEPSAYLATLQRRLGRPQSLQVSSDGRIRSPEEQVTSPLDVAFRALRGLAVAKAQMMGQDLEMEQVVLLPPPAPTTLTVPQDTEAASAEESPSQRPCVRRGNVLNC